MRYDPIGIVVAIGPSNFPFSLLVMQACAAALCGNGVILKPSERCPATSSMIRQVFGSSNLPEHLVTVFDGDKTVAERLIAHPAVGKVVFTGTSEAGLEVAKSCGQHFKPCVLELGGRGQAIVLPDADLNRAARGLLWSAMYTSGNSCIGTRAIMLLPGVRDEFERILRSEYDLLRKGNADDPESDISDSSAPSLEGAVRLVDVASTEEAIAAINASPFGLSASIWTRDKRRAEEIAQRLRVGMVWVNDASAALPQFPWGGTRRSGWGRLFAREALGELTQVKSVSIEASRAVGPKLWWFPYSEATLNLLKAVNVWLYGPARRTGLAEVIKAGWRYLFSEKRRR